MCWCRTFIWYACVLVKYGILLYHIEVLQPRGLPVKKSLSSSSGLSCYMFIKLMLSNFFFGGNCLSGQNRIMKTLTKSDSVPNVSIMDLVLKVMERNFLLEGIWSVSACCKMFLFANAAAMSLVFNRFSFSLVKFAVYPWCLSLQF